MSNFEKELKKLAKESSTKEVVLIVITFILICLALIILELAFGCFLWNVIMANVFHLAYLSFKQFVGLYILVRIFIPFPCFTNENKDE